jgi:hypothetical protein
LRPVTLFSVLALIIAVGVAVVAVIELDSRSDDDTVAIPTLLPSPSVVAPTEEPTDEETEEPAEETDGPAKPDGTLGAAQATDEPTASRTATPEPTEEPDPTPTPEPPRTPTPEPLGTVGPIDASRGNTPTTGGDAVPGGVGLAVGALALRAFVRRDRRSY